jgi:hypothetical protein
LLSEQVMVIPSSCGLGRTFGPTLRGTGSGRVEVRCLAISPDGKLLASGEAGVKGGGRLWEVATGLTAMLGSCRSGETTPSPPIGGTDAEMSCTLQRASAQPDDPKRI